MAEHLTMPEDNSETPKPKADHGGCCLLMTWGWVLFIMVEGAAFLWAQLLINGAITQCEIAHGYFSSPSTSGQVYIPSVFVSLPPNACGPFYNASFWSIHLAWNAIATFGFLALAFAGSMIWNMSQGNKPHAAVGHATKKLRPTPMYRRSHNQD